MLGRPLGDQGLIVLLPERVPSYPDSSLDDVLLHETAHVLVARAAGGRPLPRWFQEGMAMIAGRSWGRDDSYVKFGSCDLSRRCRDCPGCRGKIGPRSATCGNAASF